jgi:hypothetical protein
LSCGYNRSQILGYSPQTICSIARFAWPKILESLGDEGIKISDRPVYLFAKTIMAHPFADENGRFVRMLFASALARQLGLQLPCVAFAPSFYRYGERASKAMSVLSASGD